MCLPVHHCAAAASSGGSAETRTGFSGRSRRDNRTNDSFRKPAKITGTTSSVNAAITAPITTTLHDRLREERASELSWGGTLPSRISVCRLRAHPARSGFSVIRLMRMARST